MREPSRRRRSLTAALLVACATTSGCAVGPDYRAPDLPVAERFDAVPEVVGLLAGCPFSGRFASTPGTPPGRPAVLAVSSTTSLTTACFVASTWRVVRSELVRSRSTDAVAEKPPP